MKKTSFLSGFLALISIISSQAQTLEPSGTFMYAVKDTTSLFFDIYEPFNGSETCIDGLSKPTVLYLYGGGFMEGSRSDAKHKPWFRQLCRDGYRVIAMDYRLGLKGTTLKFGFKAVNKFYEAIDMAVSDIFSATAFLIENSQELGVDCDNMVLCGSSAGAIAALQAEWRLCNGKDIPVDIPQDFNYSGLIAGAGAIFSREGCVKYAKEPCPTLFLYGSEDKVVPPGQIWFFNISFEGSRKLYCRYDSKDYNRSIYRFCGSGHEIAGSMYYNCTELERFMESNVMKGNRRIVDAKVTAPEIIKPEWGSKTTAALFKEKRAAN